MDAKLTESQIEAAITKACGKYRTGDSYSFEDVWNCIEAALPSDPAQAPTDWRELCRRLYVELHACDQQMCQTFDEDGEPMWRTGAEVRAVLADAKAALYAAPAIPQAAEDADCRERISRALHYPACWDTAAYPTLESAAWEAIAAAKLGCSTCEVQPDERAACLCSGLGPCERPGDVSCRIARATAPQATCQTCNGNGMIGGPSFYAPDEGGDPCPDCSTPPQSVKGDEFCPYPTGIAEADRIVNRLMSSDPQFDDCTDAADLIRKLVKERRELVHELRAAIETPSVGELSPHDALRYMACRESAIERGLFATPEEYDAMVDDSLRKKGKEVLTGRGNNYGKKVAKDGSLYRAAVPQAVSLTDKQIDAAILEWFSYERDQDDFRARMRAAILAVKGAGK